MTDRFSTPERGHERQRVDITPGKRNLPRLAADHYRGHAFVHWTIGIERRATGWLTDVFSQRWDLTLVHASARYRLVCPAYVLMPDHVHLIWIGIATDSDQRIAIEFLLKHLRSAIAPCEWQHQPYDHVLRETERDQGAIRSTARYLFENPVRAGLCAAWTEYPFVGCCVPGYPEFNVTDPDYWERFWRCYNYVSNKLT